MDNTKLDKLGYLLSEPRYKTKSTISPVEPSDDLFTTPISSGGYFGYYLEQGSENLNEFHLIRTYRQMSLLPEVDSAIDDIINESINSDMSQPPVAIDLQNLKTSDKVKKKIREEFEYVLRLLDFDDKSHQIFRKWYVDGRLFFHKIIDVDKPNEGIKELRYIDPLKIKKVRVKKPKKDKLDKKTRLDFGTIDEFYIYKPDGFLNKYLATNAGTKSIPITKDSITFVPSGATDYNNNMVVSYLHKAIKASNQLQMLEDSIVIYRLCLVGDTRVSTPTGYKYIMDLNPGDTVYCFDNRQDNLVTTRVTNKWLTGVKKTFTVKSKHHSVTGTDTHPVLVRDLKTNEVTYIPIKDLKEKQHCFVYIKPKEKTQKTLIPAPREIEYKKYNNSDVNLPEYVDDDFAKFFGFLTIGGKVDKHHIQFSPKEDTKNKKYADTLKRYFGNCNYYPEKGETYSNYTSNNTLGAKVLNLLGLAKNSEDKKIPEWVFTSSDSIKKSFIEGLLDAQGIYKDSVEGYFAELKLTNKKLIEDVKEIWTSLGMGSSLIKYEKNKVVDSNNNPLPDSESWTVYLSEYPLPRFEKITSISEADEEPVYDIEVEHEKHNFVANGIVVHNSRAPERRIFYVDVGNLPTPKAEQYMKQIMNRYRTKIQYDANTGYIRDGKKHMSMLEDFFIPRKDGSKGTEIDTLPPGQQISELADLEYFQKKLYEALNVPPSRMQQESTFNIGKGSEIARDELKFAKFVARLRKQFSHLFLDILKSQLILKKVISAKDWDDYKEHIQFDYLFDNHYNELKNIEILTERLTAVSALDAYVGKYFSHRYVLSNILKLTDGEIEEIQKQIKEEDEKQMFLSKDEKMALEQQAMEGDMGQPGEEVSSGSEGQEAPVGNDINSKFRAAFGER